ncbi:hypothetical protein I4990_18195 [Providencia alcalifaciens]|uniref:hypothetical protein n=1 Tax=Providencia TaxID=586 RepID=UPI0018C4D241|nr:MULTISPECIES: hypothetical protein [Providencia]MBG5884869.1 hypothetical protein [Providencia alcalifaciens]
MMNHEYAKEILSELLKLDLIEDTTAKGIAKFAVNNEFNALSAKQLYVIEPYLTMECSGYDVHGVGEESHDLTGKELLKALRNYSENEHQVMCDHCSEDESFYQYKYDKIMDE